MSVDYRGLLLELFKAAVNAAAPALCVPLHLPSKPKGRTIVVGAGKAAAAMAAAVEAHWDGPLEGLVVTRYGHSVPCRSIEVVEASHPVPDEAGPRAARKILDKVSGLTADDLVLVLMSGGASALLALPTSDVTLADKQAINRALLACGAGIAEIDEAALGQKDDPPAVGKLDLVDLRLDVVPFEVAQSGDLNLGIEMPDIADDGAVLHRPHVIDGDDIDIAGAGDENVGARRRVLHRDDFIAFHRRL